MKARLSKTQRLLRQAAGVQRWSGRHLLADRILSVLDLPDDPVLEALFARQRLAALALTCEGISAGVLQQLADRITSETTTTSGAGKEPC